MSTDFERGLRAQMERAPVRPRPGVVREAFRRSRRQRITTRAVMAAGTAVAAAAAATIAVTVPGSPHAEAAAYVISQMSSALAAANNDIMYVSSSMAGTDANGSGHVGEQHWYYRNQSRMLSDYNGAVQDNWDTLTTVTLGTLDTTTYVDHNQRVANINSQVYTNAVRDAVRKWIKATGPACNPRVIPDYSPGENFIPNASWLSADIHALLSCAGETATWNQHVNGTEAIKLVSHMGAMTFWVWVNQATFLPIGEGISSTVKADGSMTEWFTWLPPTQANLAMLTGQIPAGYRVVHYPRRYSVLTRVGSMPGVVWSTQPPRR
jgi:hypothetical protein